MHKSLSVVIKCFEDEKVLTCIESIDESCEIIVSLSGDGVLGSLIQERYQKVKVVQAPIKNLAVSSNIGIASSSGDAVVVMDSDACFAPGSLKLIAEKLKEHPVVKPRIIYEHNETVMGSKPVAVTRQQFNDGHIRALTPGLAFRKDIAPKIGGYFFNEKVQFTEDAEFDWRLNKAGIPLLFVPKAIVYHSPTSMLHDLRAAFRMGYGHRLAIHFAGREHDNKFSGLLRRLLTGASFRELTKDCRANGFAVGMYRLLWHLCYHAGFHLKTLKLLGKNT